MKAVMKFYRKELFNDRKLRECLDASRELAINEFGEDTFYDAE